MYVRAKKSGDFLSHFIPEDGIDKIYEVPDRVGPVLIADGRAVEATAEEFLAQVQKFHQLNQAAAAASDEAETKVVDPKKKGGETR